MQMHIGVGFRRLAIRLSQCSDLTESRLFDSVRGWAFVMLAGFVVNWSACNVAAAQDMSIDRAIKLLGNEDGVAAGAAALWLGEQKLIDDQAIVALIEHLGDEREAERFPAGVTASPPTVGDYAANALQSVGSPKVVSLVCKFLRSTEDQKAQIRGLQILRAFGERARDSTVTLVRLAEDEERLIRIHAVETLSAVSVDDQAALRAFRRAIRDDDSSVKAAGVRGIGLQGAKAKVLVPELIPLLDSRELRGESVSADAGGWIPLRADVAVTLGRIGPNAEEALPKLRRMLDDEDRSVRLAAAFAHASISGSDDPGLTLLLDALKKDVGKAAEAADYVRELSSREEFVDVAFEALKAALTHRKPLVRLRAINGLAAIKSADAVELLRKTANEDNEELVRDAAEELIKKIEDK
jgi:HEAT repeat protein